MTSALSYRLLQDFHSPEIDTRSVSDDFVEGKSERWPLSAGEFQDLCWTGPGAHSYRKQSFAEARLLIFLCEVFNC